MPVTKSDSRRRRREPDTIVDCLTDSPKRTKVHAQRKFAQGCTFNSPIITPIKEVEKEKTKAVDVIPPELIPSKRPNTEDFLTFLCFRGTSILPPNLDFFNTASQNASSTSTIKNESSEKSQNDSTQASPNQPADRPFVAFGVRKRADPFVSSRMERKRRHALTVQALRRKYQDQRLAKIRAIAVSKIGQSSRPPSKSFICTRSSIRNQQVKKKPVVKQPPSAITKRQIIIKRRMCLRSGGRLNPREIIKPTRRKVAPKKEKASKKKTETESEYSSDDDQPLVKTISKLKSSKKNTASKVARKSTNVVVKPALTQRSTRSHPIEQTVSQRPTRKTKEAAALYMELLGRKLVSEAEADEDNMSIDSFPELPNVRRAEQRENEIKAQSKLKRDNKIVTRNSAETKAKNNQTTRNKIKDASEIKTREATKKEIRAREVMKKEDKKSKEISVAERKIKEIKQEEKKIKESTKADVKKLKEVAKQEDKKVKETSKIEDKKVKEISKIEEKKAKEISKTEDKKVRELVKLEDKKTKDTLKTENKKNSEGLKIEDKKVKDNFKMEDKKIKETLKIEDKKTKSVLKIEEKKGKINLEVEDNKIKDMPKVNDKKVEILKIEGKKVKDMSKIDDKKIKDRIEDKRLKDISKIEEKKGKNILKVEDNNTKDTLKIEDKKINKIVPIEDKKPKEQMKTEDRKIQKVVKGDGKKNKEMIIVEDNNVINLSKLGDNKLTELKETASKCSLKSNESVKSKDTLKEKSLIKTLNITKLKPVKSETDPKTKEVIKAVASSEVKTEVKETKNVPNSALLLEKESANNSLIPEISTKKNYRSLSKKRKEPSPSREIPISRLDEINIRKLEQFFSDSDEEPLASKIVNSEKDITRPAKKICTDKKKTVKPNVNRNILNMIEKNKPLLLTKDEEKLKDSIEIRESPSPSSDDEDEKAFRGFLKTETQSKVSQFDSKCVLSNFSSNHSMLDSSDLLCKDIDRTFGKGKVNMSNAQIEKWLNDADEELKKGSIDKDDIIEIKTSDTPEIIKEIIPLPEPPVIAAAPVIKPDIQRPPAPIERRSVFQQRRPIINKSKERAEKTPNTSAFSPENESSVYAFEAEPDLPVNTPFRRHNRRSSSTATSKSEDEAAKLEDDTKKLNKIRLPTVFKPEAVKPSLNKEVSLTLSTEDNGCASIAVQVNLDGNISEQVTLDDSLECSGQADTNNDGDGHLFYIPLQPGKESSSDSQVIQGVAVKLGTTSAGGSNQRVIMQAKLVTKPSTSQGFIPANRSLLPVQTKSSSATMYPPVGTVQPFRTKPIETKQPLKADSRFMSDTSQSSDDIKSDKFKFVPTSPSASSSSSARLNKKPAKPKSRCLEPCTATITSQFPSSNGPAQMVEAPTFHPTEREFQDPLEYIDKIRSMAEGFGLCRIIPPTGFKPECKVSDDMRFTAYNQYVHKMLHRWGPNSRELTAIRKYLATQNITLAQAPWIGGMEVDLPRLYQSVQSLGGLKEVIEKKKWPKVAEIMRIPKSAQDRLTKLDDIYCKYLLPYDTLSHDERQKLLDDVDVEWEKKKIANSQSLTSDNFEEENEDTDANECIVRGRSMALNAFYRIARNTMSMFFRSTEPSVAEVEQEFWKHVNERTNHLCVHSGSIETGGYGYGFACTKNSPFARHPWNLKVLTNNSSSILRSMGPIMGVTVPTLHVGMVFSACCWYRDPHGLPWLEYLHTGANKVWYGIPDSLNTAFRQTLNKVVPNLCRQTNVWLPSDTAMVPPSLLVSNNVSLCRTVQEPGQYIVIFPKAFTSSLCTGYTVSESVFFAQANWLENAENVFKELRESSEPSMFSLERLLLSIAVDPRCNLDVMRRVLPGVQNIRDRETVDRDKLKQLGLITTERLPQSNRKKKKADTDGEYLCEVCRSNLYVSLVTETNDDDVYCLQHAAEYLSSNKISRDNCKLMYSYTEEELNEIVDKLISAIENKSQKKCGKSNVQAL